MGGGPQNKNLLRAPIWPGAALCLFHIMVMLTADWSWMGNVIYFMKSLQRDEGKRGVGTADSGECLIVRFDLKLNTQTHTHSSCTISANIGSQLMLLSNLTVSGV